MENRGDINIYNPDKQISEQITLKNIVRHSNAMSLALDGVPEDITRAPKTPNERILNMFRGLQETISSQQIIISDIVAIIEHNSINDWNKRNKADEDKLKNPFENDDNDFNELGAISRILDEFEQEIIRAKKTKKLDDDFIWEKENHNGEKMLELTPNFFEMRTELQSTYREIHGIMLRNKIVSSGVVVDEEIEEKEKEAELVKRVLNA